MKQTNKKQKETKLLTKQEEYALVLAEIEERKGIVTAEEVVRVATAEASPLHHVFEWDTTKAAHLYRLMQARWLIKYVQVEITGQQTDGYINAIVEVDNLSMRGYVSTQTALSNKKIYQQVLSTATRELQYWQKKYRSLRDLQGVINEEKLSLVTQKIERK